MCMVETNTTKLQVINKFGQITYQNQNGICRGTTGY